MRLLDYWRVTHPDADGPATVRRVAEWLGVEFKEMGGTSRYRRGAVALNGCVRVCWDNLNAPTSVMVELTGDGMRHAESRPCFTSWRKIFHSWDLGGWRCTRLDVAIDDRAYTVPWDVPFQHVTGRCVTCNAIRGEAGPAFPGAPGGWESKVNTRQKRPGRTLYIGSRQGENFMRIYEKGRELGDPQPWLRFELEMKQRRARAAMLTLIREGENALFGMVRAFIEFRDLAAAGANRSRHQAAAWWVRLVETSKWVVNLPGRIERSMREWFENFKKFQAPKMYAYTRAAGGSIDWLDEALEDGEARQRDHHRPWYENFAPSAAIMAT